MLHAEKAGLAELLLRTMNKEMDQPKVTERLPLAVQEVSLNWYIGG